MIQKLLIQIRHKYDEDVTKCLEYVLSKSQVADWFVLYQISKNTNQYFFREFIRELAIELKLRPKRSKSRGSVGNFPQLFSLCHAPFHLLRLTLHGKTVASIIIKEMAP